MKTLKVRWTGIRPLVMHNAAMIDQDNPHVQRIVALNRDLKKLKKDDFDGREKVRREMEKEEWMGSIYWDSEDGLYVPGENVIACITAGARKIKMGKQAECAIVPLPDVIPIQMERKYPRDLEALCKVSEFSFRKPVRIPPRTGARLMKVRPVVPTGWSIEFEIEFDEKEFPEKDLIEAMQCGGSLAGLGDWRPRFGRFLVEIIS